LAQAARLGGVRSGAGCRGAAWGGPRRSRYLSQARAKVPLCQPALGTLMGAVLLHSSAIIEGMLVAVATCFHSRACRRTRRTMGSTGSVRFPKLSFTIRLPATIRPRSSAFESSRSVTVGIGSE
jgi:hypothetical protein